MEIEGHFQFGRRDSRWLYLTCSSCLKPKIDLSFLKQKLSTVFSVVFDNAIQSNPYVKTDFTIASKALIFHFYLY